MSKGEREREKEKERATNMYVLWNGVKEFSCCHPLNVMLIAP